MTVLRFVLLIAIAGVSTGCGASIHKYQYDRLKLGMTVAEVEEVLGKGKPLDKSEVERLLQDNLKPAGQAEGVPAPKIEMDRGEYRGVRWGSEKKQITIIYQNERLFRLFQQGL